MSFIKKIAQRLNINTNKSSEEHRFSLAAKFGCSVYLNKTDKIPANYVYDDETARYMNVPVVAGLAKNIQKMREQYEYDVLQNSYLKRVTALNPDEMNDNLRSAILNTISPGVRYLIGVATGHFGLVIDELNRNGGEFKMKDVNMKEFEYVKRMLPEWDMDKALTRIVDYEPNKSEDMAP